MNSWRKWREEEENKIKRSDEENCNTFWKKKEKKKIFIGDIFEQRNSNFNLQNKNEWKTLIISIVCGILNETDWSQIGMVINSNWKTFSTRSNLSRCFNYKQWPQHTFKRICRGERNQGMGKEPSRSFELDHNDILSLTDGMSILANWISGQRFFLGWKTIKNDQNLCCTAKNFLKKL